MKQNGFTLVEVLVALVILTVAFSALVVSIGENARNIGFMEKKTAASWVASNVFARAQLGLLNLNQQTKQSSGEEAMLGEAYQWSLSITSTENTFVNELNVEVKSSGKVGALLNQVGFMRGENES